MPDALRTKSIFLGNNVAGVYGLLLPKKVSMNLPEIQTAVKQLNLSDQRRLLDWLQQAIAAAEQVTEPAESDVAWQPPGAETAQAMRHIGRSCFLLQGVKCGKPGCKCSHGKLHGPYWYEFWREDGKVRKRYHGKRIQSVSRIDDAGGTH